MTFRVKLPIPFILLAEFANFICVQNLGVFSTWKPILYVGLNATCSKTKLASIAVHFDVNIDMDIIIDVAVDVDVNVDVDDNGDDVDVHIDMNVDVDIDVDVDNFVLTLT